MGSHSWHLRGVALGVQPITIPNDQQAAMSKHQQWLLSYVACCGHGVECALRCESMIWKFAQTSNPRSMDCSPHLPYTDYACKKQFFHSLYSCPGRGQLPGSILAVSSVSKAPNGRGFSKTMLLSWQDSQLKAIIKLNCKVCATVREMQRQVLRDIPVSCLENRFPYINCQTKRQDLGPSPFVGFAVF